MKTLLLLILTFSLQAQIAGDLDTTYGNQGLVVEHFPNTSSLHLASVLDSQGRLLVLKARSAGSIYDLFVYRYLANGIEDTSYTPFASEIDAFLIDGNFTLAVDSSDGVFLGYSNYTCVAVNTECQQDVFIKHYNNTGILIGSQTIAFDFGNTYLRQNDKFADLVYIPNNYGHNTAMLAVAATIDLSDVFDTDFGVALLNVSLVGPLSLRTTFAGNGKTTCAFDQDIGHTGIGVDEAKAIEIEEESPIEIIVGGSAFEGNGANNNGWNLAFCKLRILGDVFQSWSTLPLPNTLNDVEILQDMYYSTIGVNRLIVAAKFSTGTDNDFVIGEYTQASNQWTLDTTFGTNGWASIGFNQLFIGATNDIIQSLTVEPGLPDISISVVGNMQWQDNGIDYSKIAMARFDEFGVLNPNWGVNGTRVYDFSNNNKTIVKDMVYDSNINEFYLVGHFPNGIVNDAYIANISDKSDLIFKNSFE